MLHFFYSIFCSLSLVKFRRKIICLSERKLPVYHTSYYRTTSVYYLAELMTERVTSFCIIIFQLKILEWKRIDNDDDYSHHFGSQEIYIRGSTAVFGSLMSKSMGARG